MASVDGSSSSNKRRRTAVAADNSNSGLQKIYLSDLTIGILEHTASFLAPLSRALFAITLTNNENNPPREENYSSIAGSDWLPIDFGDIETDLAALTNNENNNLPSENYSSIAGSDWETLDFGEVEKDLATKLSDDDISAVLQHIDAVNKVKRLRLTNCTNITGGGIEPLSGSEVIEQIDLSLTAVGEDPKLVPEPPISCELVLPVLDSIIAREGCTLKHLQFPYKWRQWRRRQADPEFHAFIRRYNEMLNNRDTVSCLNCDVDLPEDGYNWINIRDGSKLYGKNKHTCCQCLKHYCYNCPEEEDEKDCLRYCNSCQRDYCRDCVKIVKCGNCHGFACEHCFKDKECDNCKDMLCPECVRDDSHECSYCGVLYCNNCNVDDGAGVDQVNFCEECEKICCKPCRMRVYQEGGIDCINCIKLLPDEAIQSLIELKQEVEDLRNEVGELKIENRELKGANKELQDEVKELKDKQGKSMMTE